MSAAIAVLGLAADAKERDTTIVGLLDELAAEIGHFASGQVSLRVDDLGVISRVMSSLRTDEPTAFGERAVTSAEDLAAGVSGAPSGDVLRYRLDDGSRVIVRPSGTEPKLKVYIDARAESAEQARDAVAALETAVRALLSERSV